MKIFNKKENTDSKEDTLAGAENSATRNSGSSAEEANGTQGNSKKLSPVRKLKKALRLCVRRKTRFLRTSLSGSRQTLIISENGLPARLMITGKLCLSR